MSLRKYAAEFFGTSILVATVIGSGIMAEQLSPTDQAIALLANTIATGAILFVIISIFSDISGAHFNPVVSVIMVAAKQIDLLPALFYTLCQILGGLFGMMIAHLMFDLPVVQISENIRTGNAQYFSELVATFGLVLSILLGMKYRPNSLAMLVGLYITAAYWFTASTSFANPAVTIARTFTNSFSGIFYGDSLPFIAFQFLGGALAFLLYRVLASD
jgi:glycerol uptake facilitator-like aquaporin